jgi:hypothetical protein
MIVSMRLNLVAEANVKRADQKKCDHQADKNEISHRFDPKDLEAGTMALIKLRRKNIKKTLKTY